MKNTSITTNHSPLLVIVGETASGKSALAMELARRFNGEIISADSWTVYKDFDIGTAKPSKLERAQIPHHLLDVADARGGFNVVVFQEMAQAAINVIAKRGKLPILVGGSGLYIDSIIYHYGFLAAPPVGMREELNALSLDELVDRAERQGFLTREIDTRNKRRVVRLIESDGQLPTRQPLRANTLLVGVRRPADELRDRITKRIDDMVEAGFVDEVRRLGEQYGWDVEAMRAPGYRAFTDYVQGNISLDAAKERFRQNDLQLAKKQRTWFKRNKSIHWFDTPVKMAEIVDLVTTHLDT